MITVRKNVMTGLAIEEEYNIYVVQRRDLIRLGEIDPSENGWENKIAFTNHAQAFKYIQINDPNVKKATKYSHDYHYVGDNYEWHIDVISLVIAKDTEKNT